MPRRAVRVKRGNRPEHPWYSSGALPQLGSRNPIKARGAHLRPLTEHLDTTTSAGTLIFQVVARSRSTNAA